MPVQEFYFAWVEPDEAFDPEVHNREDEKIVRFRVEQIEGEFATLSIDIKNPRIGLLNAGRKLWAYLSYHDGTDVVAIFFGRVVGIPSNIHRQVVTLDFLARPTNFGAQKDILAANMRDLPYWDPVFVRPELWDDPDVVLEGRTELWATDRVDHIVTTSDLVVGEDGVVEFQEAEVPEESVALSFDQPPIRRVRMTADVSWNQEVAGQGLRVLNNWKVETLAAAGVISGWPKSSEVLGGSPTPRGFSTQRVITKGGSLGGGWYTFFASAASPYQNMTDADWSGWYLSQFPPPPDHGVPPFYVDIISAFSATVSEGKAENSATHFAIISDYAVVNLTAGYEATRQRKDIITFDLVADSQPIVTDPDDGEVLILTVSGNDIGQPDPFSHYTGAIGSKLFRSYFNGVRGKLSIQYLIQLARANIVLRSRAVRVSWECKFDRAVELSLRKNALLNHRLMPGGQALGKIVAYNLQSDGGRVTGEVTIGCCIGYGGTITPSDGEPTYVEDGYVSDGYQMRENQVNVLGASDVGFVSVIARPNDDGLVFPLRVFPFTINPHNTTVYEKGTTPQPFPTTGSATVTSDDCGDTTSVSVSSAVDTSPYTDWLSGIKTTVDFRMKSVEGGPFETIYPLTVTPLQLPKQIDLEAAAT